MINEKRRSREAPESLGNTQPEAQGGLTAAIARITNVCPVCGDQNPPDAVFCSNAVCHKALGEFPYVLEELRSEAEWHETLAQKVTAFIGRPHFLLAHGFWLALWVVVNTGIIAFVRQFDVYPFGLLGIILAVEAVLMTGFILISSNRQSAHADKRAELDYEVNVRNSRAIHEIDGKLQQILARLDGMESAISQQERALDCEARK